MSLGDLNVGHAILVRRLRVAVAVACLSLGISGCGTDPVAATDSDGDGLSDARELLLGTDPNRSDSDFDGLSDGFELANGTSPLALDSDRDGIADGADPVVNSPSRGGGSVSSGNDVEPNDSFDQAAIVIATESGSPGSPNRTPSFSLDGRIDLHNDVDVFLIPAMSGGDRIDVVFDPLLNDIAPTIGIFDATQALVSVVNTHAFGLGLDGPVLAPTVLRGDLTEHFLAITRSVENVSLGDYFVDVSLIRGGTLPPAVPQVFLLNFDGGTLDRPLLGVSTVAAFDAGAIDARYADAADEIKRAIVATFEGNFDGFNVVVVTSEAEAAHFERFSTLLLGSFSATTFGVSRGVDNYNSNQCDDGIVFAETFAPHGFGFTPSAEAIGVAIGNVAAHEAGHLLGLNHVFDPQAIMDESSPGIHLLSRQDFKTAPLAPGVFPIGNQNARELLLQTVGAG